MKDTAIKQPYLTTFSLGTLALLGLFLELVGVDLTTTVIITFVSQSLCSLVVMKLSCDWKMTSVNVNKIIVFFCKHSSREVKFYSTEIDKY